MVKISVPSDCGNAPRKEIVRDYNLAFAESDLEKILSFMAEDITWEMVGQKTMHGKAEARSFLETMGDDLALELVINTIITHGDTAAADGKIVLPTMTIAFCDIYKFSGHDKNAKIKELTSFSIELK